MGTPRWGPADAHFKPGLKWQDFYTGHENEEKRELLFVF